jgi:hypothetical protein
MVDDDDLEVPHVVRRAGAMCRLEDCPEVGFSERALWIERDWLGVPHTNHLTNEDLLIG